VWPLRAAEFKGRKIKCFKKKKLILYDKEILNYLDK
jgi:hypothetical protein